MDSGGTYKLSRRNGDNPFEVKAKVALIREARAERNLRQAGCVSARGLVPFQRAARLHTDAALTRWLL